MAFNQMILDHYTALGLEGHLPLGAKVLDFGSQNVHQAFDPEAVQNFMMTFNHANHASDTLTTPGVKLEGLMAAAGFDYTAFDMYNEGRTRKFDLNWDALPEEERGTFDFVGNLGTSEHVANQLNVFKVAHDALKTGGVMYNIVPFHGCIDHGLFNYHPKFFTTLIRNNGYEPLYWKFTEIYEGLLNQDHYVGIDQADNGPYWNGRMTGSALMVIIFKKRLDAPFRPPTDALLEGDVAVPFPTVNEILNP